MVVAKCVHISGFASADEDRRAWSFSGPRTLT